MSRPRARRARRGRPERIGPRAGPEPRASSPSPGGEGTGPRRRREPPAWPGFARGTRFRNRRQGRPGLGHRLPWTPQREVVRPSPKAPPDRPLLGRTLDAHEGIATRTVGDAVKDPRLAAFVADEPPVKVAPRESGLADVCRAPRPILGIVLPNSDAVAAPVRRHGPTRNPETPNYALESGLRLAPA